MTTVARVGQVVDLSALLSGAPRNCWLALTGDETAIVGRGETIQEAVAEARKAGVEDPVILWSPKERVPAIF